MYPPVTQFETRALRHAPPVPEPLRVVVAGAQPLMRARIARVLEERGFEVVAQACGAEELRREARAHRPDAVIADRATLPAANTLRSELPRVGVLVVSDRLEETAARALLEGGAGGVGYLLETRLADGERFAAALRRVAAGGSVLDAEVVAAMGHERHRVPAALLHAHAV